MDLQAVLQLFLRHGSDPALHVRHLAALEQLGGANGFAVRDDLLLACRIAHCTLDLCGQPQHAAAFLEPTRGLIRALGRPYSKHSASDELQLPAALAALLQLLARVLSAPLPAQLKTAAAQVVADFASVWGHRPEQPATLDRRAAAVADLHSVGRTYETHQRLLEGCSMAATLCACLTAVVRPPAQQCCASTTDSLLAALLAALQECSFSQPLCEQQLRAGVLPALSALLLQDTAGGAPGSLSTQALDLLWNLLEGAGAAADADAAAAAAASSLPALQPSPAVPQQQASGQQQQQHQHQHQQQQQAMCMPAQLVHALAQLLQCQCVAGASLQLKQQRNDTLAVLCHLSKCRRNMAHALVHDSALMQLLLAAAMGTSCCSCGGSSNATANEASVTADHTMQLLAWSTLGDVAAASGPGLTALLQAGLLGLLLSVAQDGSLPAGGCSSTTMASVAAWWARLAPEQLAASQHHAWLLLQQLVPLCRREFVGMGGVSMLLSVLHGLTSARAGGAASATSAWLSTQPALAASAATTRRAGSPSALPQGARTATTTPAAGPDFAAAEAALQLLRRLVRGDAAAAQAVLEQGAAPQLLQLLHVPPACALPRVRQGVLLALSELCGAGGRAAASAVREAGGVALLLRDCQSILEGDPHVPGLAALGCLWRCCLGSARSRAQLLAADGMDTLLSLLQRSCGGALQPVLLSLLADLLADVRAHSFFWQWYAPALAGSGWGSSTSGSREVSFGASLPRVASDSGGAAAAGHQAHAQAVQTPAASAANTITSAQLLVAIWREQAAALGVLGPDGVLLADACRPLAAGAAVPCNDAQHQPAPAAVMAKVYACFAALGVAGEHGGSRAVCTEGLAALQALPPTDAAALAAICAHAAFRRGEVWQHIKAALAAQGTEPTPEDSERLESGIVAAEGAAAEVQAAQAALLGAAQAANLAAEHALYGNMIAQRAADARAKVYDKDISKLTMRERAAAKVKRDAMLSRACVAAPPDVPQVAPDV